MTEHNGLPVSGYLPQTNDKIELVNQNKTLEEQVLRHIEKVRDSDISDSAMAEASFFVIQDAFMWLNRSIFQPSRIKLGDDK